MNPGAGGSEVSVADARRFARALGRLPLRQGRRERLLRSAIRAWCRLVAWDVTVDMAAPLPVRDGIPGAGCVVVAAPHRAWLEPFLLLLAWPPDAARLVWLADGRTVTRARWRRWLLPRLGVIPVSAASGGPRAYAALAAAACDRGHAIAIFPEVGPPSAPDRVRRISPGFAYLALGAGAAVVPVTIGGTHHIVRGSSFSLDIGRALDVGGPLTDPFTPAVRERAHDLVRAFESELAPLLVERTRQADAKAPARDRWRWLAKLLG